MFEQLLKYPQSDYNAGTLTFLSGWPLWLLIALIVLTAAILGFSLWLQRNRLSAAKLCIIGVLQTAVAALLLIMLWQPALDVQNLKVGENTVAVLLDRSQSMRYGHRGESRRAQALSVLDKIDSPLKDNFTVRYGSIGEDLQWADNLQTTTTAATQSQIAASLIDALDQARAEPLASVILASDGSDNSDYLASANPDFWAQLQAFNVPVHTIGIGREVITEDTEIVDIDLPAVTLPGSVEQARVTLRHGNAKTARIKVYDGDSIIAIEERALPGNAGDTTFEIDIDAPNSGLRELRFEVEPDAADKMLANNSRKRLLQVAEQQRRILYFEGEPRWEYKFIRRAVNDAQGLSLVTILRTTPNKFYRQGIDRPEQHANGFPASKEELYAYDAVIIGNVDAISLTAVQHQLIHDFVAKRGGTLLMLAGKNALADGGWYNSPVAKTIPVAMPASKTPTFERIRARAQLTPGGAQSPIARFVVDAEQNAQLWSELPELADFQRTGKPKPGATVLLGVELPDGSYPLLSRQRYGDGQAYVLASSGTWRWQMQLPSEDQRHEQFWRQLLQTMGNSAPKRFEVSTDRQIYRDNSQVTINATLLDKVFKPSVNDTINATLLAPDGTSQTIPLTAGADQAGEFSASFDAPVTGSWRLDVDVDVAASEPQATDAANIKPTLEDSNTAPAAGKLATTHWIYRDDSSAEDFNLAQNAAFLKRIAAASGGSYWQAEDASGLPQAIRAARNGVVQLQSLPLWNLPLFFLLILWLKLLEWMLRLLWGRL